MPTVNPSPFTPKPQFEGTDGLPLVGGKLFFYAAGSSTKQTTYTDSTGTVGNSNPLILDASGRPSTEVWFTAGQTYKMVLAPSTDTDPPTSPIFTVDNIKGINDTTVTQDQWVSGPTPTYVSATSFTLVGDQTSTFTVGRRVKTTNSGGTVYSTIITSVFGALTTVTVQNDSSTLDAGLSAVSYGLLSSTNVSFPGGGPWTTPTFAAGNFTGGGGTWTVGSGDVGTYAYNITGKTMIVAFTLSTTTVAGTTAGLSIAIPASRVAAKTVRTMCYITDNGARTTGFATVSASGTTIDISRTDVANFTASVDNTGIFGQIVFEVT